MDTIKAFFKEKGLYLVCLALVFGATAAGIVAIRSVVQNFANWAESRHLTEEENVWNQPDALANQPATDVPEPPRPSAPSVTPAPGPSSSASSPSNGGGQGAVSGSSASSGSQGASPAVSGPVEGGAVSVPFSGDELIYHPTLADWRTHNGADYAAAAGAKVVAVQGGTVAAVYDDALWGGVVEVTDASGTVWRYCGLTDCTLQRGETVQAGDTLGKVSVPPAEADGGAHIHLERTKDGAYLDPAA